MTTSTCWPRIGPATYRTTTQADQVRGEANTQVDEHLKGLDWTLVLGRRHLERALREYVAHYNAKRPHRGIDLQAPDSPLSPPAPVPSMLRVRRSDVLGGLIREYELVA